MAAAAAAAAWWSETSGGLMGFEMRPLAAAAGSNVLKEGAGYTNTLKEYIIKAGQKVH